MHAVLFQLIGENCLTEFQIAAQSSEGHVPRMGAKPVGGPVSDAPASGRHPYAKGVDRVHDDLRGTAENVPLNVCYHFLRPF